MKLYWKLFLALFAAVLIGAGALALLSQWRLDQGFVAYVNAADATLLPELADIAGQIHARDGGWEGIRADPRRWFRQLRMAVRLVRRPELDDEGIGEAPGPAFGPRRPPRQNPPGSNADRFTRPPPGHNEPVQPRRRVPLPERIAIVDSNGALVVGRFQPSADMPRASIEVDGVTVGQVVLQPADRPASVEDTAFLLAQRDWLLRVVLIMLPIAALLAWLLARHLLAPVHSISSAARRLAAGDFKTRIEVTGSDELGQLAVDFNLLGRALAEYDGARRRWMADAAHELRTPLAVLQAEIEALQDGIRRVDARALQGLHTRSLQLARLVNDLQQLALADVGALDYQMAPLDVDAELLAVVEAHRSRLGEAGIALQLSPETAIEARVLGDARRLRQLFDNLIENARRYTRAPGQLRITRRRDGDHWQVDFDDSEPGVAAERCERLFDPFVRDPERLRGDPDELAGSGLGLAICRRIAQAHAAQLEASPSPLGGLRISLRIPLSR
jgi:two-component system sensor histidine kinase BaeS